MLNIIKAQSRQFLKDRFTWYTLFVGFVFPILIIILNSGSGFDALSGSAGVPALAEISTFILPMVLLIFTSRTCGWDSADKTINYEVLSGHTRKEIYMGRVVVSAFWSWLAGFCIMVFPVFVISAVNGWGVSMSLRDAVFRMLLAMLVLFRLLCEFVLLTVILGDCYKAMVVGLPFYNVSIIGAMMIHELTEIKAESLLASAGMMRLADFSRYSLQYIGGEDVCVYDAALPVSLALDLAVSSLAAGAVCLLLGYIIFRKRDL